MSLTSIIRTLQRRAESRNARAYGAQGVTG